MTDNAPQIEKVGLSKASPARTPVRLTDSERAEIQAAMHRDGIRNLSDFLRFAALRLARE